MFTPLTFLYIALIFVPGALLGLSFVLGEVSDFGDQVTDAIGGIGDSIGDAIGGIGDIFHGLTGADIDTDVGGLDTGGLEGGDHETAESGGPSPFSLRTLLGFAFGFGGGGLAGKGAGMIDFLSLIPAFGAGLVTSLIVWVIARFFYAAQGSISVQETDYIGLIARVFIPIPEDGMGLVAVTVKGEIKNIPASSGDKTVIPAQTQVEIVGMEGGTALVKKL